MSDLVSFKFLKTPKSKILNVWQDLFFSAEGRYILAWQLPELTSRYYIDAGQGDLTALVVNNDAHHLISVGPGDKIKIWDLSSMQLVGSLDSPVQPLSQLYYANNSYYAVSNNLKTKECTITQINPVDFTPQQVFKGHREGIKSLTFYKNVLISCSKDHTARAWDTATGKCIQVMSCNALRLSILNETQVAIFTYNEQAGDRIELWNYSSGELVKEIPLAGIISTGPGAADILMEGNLLIMAREGEFSIYDIATNHLDHIPPIRKTRVGDCKLLKDGDRVYLFTANNNIKSASVTGLAIWDLPQKRWVLDVHGIVEEGYSQILPWHDILFLVRGGRSFGRGSEFKSGIEVINKLTGFDLTHAATRSDLIKGVLYPWSRGVAFSERDDINTHQYLSLIDGTNLNKSFSIEAKWYLGDFAAINDTGYFYRQVNKEPKLCVCDLNKLFQSEPKNEEENLEQDWVPFLRYIPLPRPIWGPVVVVNAKLYFILGRSSGENGNDPSFLTRFDPQTEVIETIMQWPYPLDRLTSAKDVLVGWGWNQVVGIDPTSFKILWEVEKENLKGIDHCCMGNYMITGTKSEKIYVWDLRSGNKVQEWSVPGCVTAVEVDGQKIYANVNDMFVIIDLPKSFGN